MYCYTYNCNKPKAFSQYFWATYFHPKEKGRVMCALQYLHVSISNYTKAVLGTSFRCLCLSLPQIMHISFLFIFDAVYQAWNAFLLPLSSLLFHLYSPLLLHTLMSLLRMTNKNFYLQCYTLTIFNLSAFHSI